MPVITCTVAEDGKLIPSMVEFEPGEVIEFKSEQRLQLQGERSTDIEVYRAINLNEFTVHPHDGAIEISLTQAKRPDWVARDLRLPPPPPPHIVVKIPAGKSADKGGQHSGAAGATSS